MITLNNNKYVHVLLVKPAADWLPTIYKVYTKWNIYILIVTIKDNIKCNIQELSFASYALYFLDILFWLRENKNTMDSFISKQNECEVYP